MGRNYQKPTKRQFPLEDAEGDPNPLRCQAPKKDNCLEECGNPLPAPRVGPQFARKYCSNACAQRAFRVAFMKKWGMTWDTKKRYYGSKRKKKKKGERE